MGVRRGDRLAVFVQAGVGVFVVQALVVITFALLGDQDVRGVLELVGAAAVSAGGADRGGRRAASRSSGPCSGS